MTRTDFIDWKRHPVTQQVFSQLNERIDSLLNELVAQAQEGNTTTQAFKAGAIEAYRDVVQIEFEGEDLK